MASSERNEEGHSGTEEQRGKRNGHEKKAALRSERRHLGDVVRLLARELPRRAEEGMRERPQTTLAAVAGASFVLGTLLGTRVIRAALYAAVPYVAVQVMKGELGERVLGYASELMGNLGAQDRSRMEH